MEEFDLDSESISGGVVCLWWLEVFARKCFFTTRLTIGNCNLLDYAICVNHVISDRWPSEVEYVWCFIWVLTTSTSIW